MNHDTQFAQLNDHQEVDFFTETGFLGFCALIVCAVGYGFYAWLS